MAAARENVCCGKVRRKIEPASELMLSADALSKTESLTVGRKPVQQQARRSIRLGCPGLS